MRQIEFCLCVGWCVLAVIALAVLATGVSNDPAWSIFVDGCAVGAGVVGLLWTWSLSHLRD